MKTYSMNDYIYFKLTEAGHKILDKKSEEFHKALPAVDINYKWEPYYEDWYREQLHRVFDELGGFSYVGQLLSIESITFECPEFIKEKLNDVSN